MPRTFQQVIEQIESSIRSSLSYPLSADEWNAKMIQELTRTVVRLENDLAYMKSTVRHIEVGLITIKSLIKE